MSSSANTNQDQESRSRSWLPLASACALIAGTLGWAYWPTIVEMVERWESDPQYSHGYIVPLISIYLLWAKREQLTSLKWTPGWWGVPFGSAALGMRFAGAYFYYAPEWVDGLSLLVLLMGLCVTLGGWAAFRITFPAIGFLIFMLPLPYGLETMLSQPLRRTATLAGTFSLQVLGFNAVSQGNIIWIGDIALGVEEACSGLSMLMVFAALSTAVILIVNRPIFDKLLILASAVPIAILVNVIRITATGILHHTAGSEIANLVFHDLAGWLMMPIALGFMWLEMKALDMMFLQSPEQSHAASARLVSAGRS